MICHRLIVLNCNIQYELKIILIYKIRKEFMIINSGRVSEISIKGIVSDSNNIIL